MKQKADSLFIIYLQMGVDRSLKKLADLCGMMGVKISEQTLERYSVKYEWQRRLLEAQSKEAEMIERDSNRVVDDMNRQDAGIAQGMKALVIGGIRYYQDNMRRMADERVKQGLSNDQLLYMDFGDIANLAKSAQQIERLARGQATSRVDVWVQVASTIVREFVLIFQAVNKLGTEEDRENEFLRLGEDMMQRYYAETAKNQLGGDYNTFRQS